MQVNDDMVRAAARVVEPRPWESDYDAGSISAFNAQGREERAMEIARAALTAALAAMWNGMDTAPKDGERILLGWRGEMSAEGFWHDGSQNYWKKPGWYFADDDVLTGRPCDPDCWQNLPSPPKTEG